MVVHGLLRQEEPLGDVGIAKTLRDQLQHLGLALGELKCVLPGGLPGTARQATGAQLTEPSRRHRRRCSCAQPLELGERVAKAGLVAIACASD